MTTAIALPTFSNVPDALAWLVRETDDSLHGLRMYFQSIGFRGVPGDGTDCIIARWLTHVVKANISNITVFVQGGMSDGKPIVSWLTPDFNLHEAPLPPSLNKFGCLFDDVRYEELLDQ